MGLPLVIVVAFFVAMSVSQAAVTVVVQTLFILGGLFSLVTGWMYGGHLRRERLPGSDYPGQVKYGYIGETALRGVVARLLGLVFIAVPSTLLYLSWSELWSENRTVSGEGMLSLGAGDLGCIVLYVICAAIFRR
jgi:hypothetical protein